MYYACMRVFSYHDLDYLCVIDPLLNEWKYFSNKNH